ncbi:uncharacterized protein LOC116613003 isoform X2 [Nematostella vectensis]|uniref:uncharacterized protein LOC116613003 isoform X2 n=1 Tax=Nematostella vectensis TaxID=45351 RepID=UPI0013903BCB|nr:uncharacterized protein LOC116613003 isoform X2 [Nematostella vectensis]
MVKLAQQGLGANDQLRSSNLVCYICGAANANWPVYSKPSRFSVKNPFFPFLDYHVPPSGARAIDRETGAVDACTVCFSFLTQQWSAFEAKDTPISKRLYWRKRSGTDGVSEITAENYQARYPESRISNESERVRENNNSASDEDAIHSESHTESVPNHVVKVEESEFFFGAEEVNDTAKNTAGSSNHDRQEMESPKPDSSVKGAVEMCYVCSRKKPKEFMRSVHTRAQLKTETPFYPCLSKHSPPVAARKMDYLGKVLVCEACQKFLFRQWQVFQKNSTPLSERQYQLRSDPSLPRDQQSQLSTMVCFICGVTQPATSGRFLYSRKHTAGDPFYPFLNSITPPSGAMPLTKQGLTRACSGCRKSLHRQWKQFEASEIPEEDRDYKVRNESVPAASNTDSHLVCYTCGEICPESNMRPIYTKIGVNPLKGSFCFPFIALLQPRSGCRPIDSMGRTLVCKRCFRFLQSKWEQFESEKVPHQMRIYAVCGHENIRLKAKCHACFLCGFEYSKQSPWRLNLYPQSSESSQDGGPFFPFLAHREPKPGGSMVEPEGSVIVCEVCFTNLMNQWEAYERSVIPAEGNRWLRKYRVTTVICYLCGVQKPRESCLPVSRSIATLSAGFRVPRGSLVVNHSQDVVLCSDCHEKIRPEGITRDVSAAHDQRQGSQQISTDPYNNHPKPQGQSVIVIDSSGSDTEDASPVKQEEFQPRVSPVGHAASSSMHFTASASPGVPPHMSKERPVSISPSSNLQPASRRSFAAELRKLASKQAMPSGSACSPVSSPGGSKPGSPNLSLNSSRSAGMSPSRNSPVVSSTPPISRPEPAHSAERLAYGTDRDLKSISTPPMPPIPALDPDHRNQTGDGTVSQSGHRPNPSPLRSAHEVLPGVYATRPGYPHEPSTMLSEQFPGDHAPHALPYYLQGAKPDMPMFLPRAGPIPGPPPLLGSKREGPDAHMSQFYPAPFPPDILGRPHQDRSSPKLPSADKDKKDSEGPPGESRDQGSMSQRMYYFNESTKPPSCPVHGHGTPPEGHHKHRHRGSPASEQHGDRPERPPEELSRMYLPPHPDGAALMHPFLIHRESPFTAHHLGDRQVEMMRERQELLHQRLIMDQREHIKAREEEWQRRQQHLRQEKEDRQRELSQYRHQVLHRHEHMGMEPRRPASKSPSTVEHHPNHSLLRHPYHLPFHPPPIRQPFGDPHRKDAHLTDAHKEGHVHPYSYHNSRFEGFPYSRDMIVTSMSAGERGRAVEGEWPRHGRLMFVNGDLADVEMRRTMSPGLHQRIKIEKPERESSPPVRVKHDESKLKFLEGLGLVTLDRKKELTHGDPNARRKFTDSPLIVEGTGSQNPASGETQVTREEAGDTSSDGTSEGDSGTGTSTDTDVSQQYAEKCEFFARLGLVPPHTRQEMEQSYEIKRSERKKRRRKGRGRPSKRPRREDEENSEKGRSPIDFDGPLTRQKQQQLNELLSQSKDVQPKPQETNDEKAAPVRIKTEHKEEPEPPYMFDKQEGHYRRARDSPSSENLANRPPPRLTLSSLTNMEDPFTNYEASTFRPPYLRHTGLLSVSQDSMHMDPRVHPEARLHPDNRLHPEALLHPDSRIPSSHRVQPEARLHPEGIPHLSEEVRLTTPVRPEPVRSRGISLSEKETRDYLSRRSSPGRSSDYGRQFGSMAGQHGSSFEKFADHQSSSGSKDVDSNERYRWPGVEKVMKAYFLHNGERNMELSYLQDNANMLKSHNVSLNEEANALSSQMTNLAQTKRQLLEEKKVYRQDLDRLHYFMQSFQR